MKNKETVEEFALRVLHESNTDVNINYCIENGIKYDNHEIDASKIDLFTTKSNKAAFDFVIK